MTNKVVGVFGQNHPREKKEITLPSGRKVTVLEMTGREEMLLKIRTGKVYDALNAFFGALTEGLDGKEGHPDAKQLDEMLVQDRNLILLEIRRLTHGDVVERKGKCGQPTCGADMEHEIDLKDVVATLKPYPHGDQREFSVKTAAGEIFYELPTGNSERSLESDNGELNINSHLSKLRLWEVTPSGNMPVRVEDLKSKYIVALRKSVRDNSAVLDTTVTLTCPRCHGENTVNVLGDRDFLFPALV